MLSIFNYCRANLQGISLFVGIHQDSSVLSSENNAFGGFRVTTFMIYLSDVESGGHTVFPQAGVSVKPEEGKALFWFNCEPCSQNPSDSTTYHLGCLVLHGNKQIANKWVKILPQFKNYPCHIKNPDYYSTVI